MRTYSFFSFFHFFNNRCVAAIFFFHSSYIPSNAKLRRRRVGKPRNSQQKCRLHLLPHRLTNVCQHGSLVVFCRFQFLLTDKWGTSSVFSFIIFLLLLFLAMLWLFRGTHANKNKFEGKQVSTLRCFGDCQHVGVMAAMSDVQQGLFAWIKAGVQ